MHDEHPHPLLAQVPLTVSPFISLPTATPLPYTYKQLPSTLPPSVLSSSSSSNNNNNPTSTPHATDPSTHQQLRQQHQDQQHQHQQPAYVVSSTGTSATPDQILTSCLALQSHLQKLETEARTTLKAWEDKRKAAELAEKRRVAPGWLDGDVRLLRPENVGGGGAGDTVMGEAAGADAQAQSASRQGQSSAGVDEGRHGVLHTSEGEELDRAFGGMDIK